MEKLKWANNNNKILFRLNDRLFQQNLPKILKNKFEKQDKENTFLFAKNESIIEPHLKKTIKLFNMPKRFKKHNNKIQDNVALLNKTATSQYHTAISKTCSSSFYKGPCNDTNLKQKNKIPQLSRKRIGLSTMQQSTMQKYMSPKTLQEIQKQFEQKYVKIQEQRNIYKRRLEEKQNKTIRKSQTISQLFQKNKQSSMLSRFTLLQLKSYYCSILNFAKGDIKKFKYSFEIMLNLANVTVRETIMVECLKQLLNGDISFNKFLKSFTDIQERLRKQAILDYFQILLQELKKPVISYEQLVKTFEGRMKKEIASQLTQLLYEKMGKQYTESINKKQIHALCYSNDQFCNRFYALNHQNMLSNKFSNPDQ